MRLKVLDLPHGWQTVIEEGDWPLVRDLTLYRGQNGYVYFSTWQNGQSRPQTLHRYITPAPSGMHVDHINGDKLDNRRSNLRVVTPQHNQVNRRRLNRNNSSGARGVVYRPGAIKPWRAQITVSHRCVHLGVFATKLEAVAARRLAEVEHYGELCP